MLDTINCVTRLIRKSSGLWSSSKSIEHDVCVKSTRHEFDCRQKHVFKCRREERRLHYSSVSDHVCPRDFSVSKNNNSFLMFVTLFFLLYMRIAKVKLDVSFRLSTRSFRFVKGLFHANLRDHSTWH